MARDDSRTDTDDATRCYLHQVLRPFWFVPGVLDWWLHKKIRIEQTSGTRESLIHAAMVGEIGLPSAAALVLGPNAGLLALMGTAAVTHHAAIKDVRT
jgi:hypothetical protein